MVANPNQQTGHDNPIQTSSEDTFRLVAETRKQVNEVTVTARDAIKHFYTDPQRLAEFIERYDTPVYVLRVGWLVMLILRILGFEPGFIPPCDSKQGIWLQRLLSFCEQDRPGCQQSAGMPSHFENGVFVLTRPLFSVGFLTHQLHHWLACRSGMDGYSDRAQKLYKQFWLENRGRIGKEVYKMDAEDILALKAAINRDMEALKFLKAMTDEVLIPGRQARRISHGTASA